MGNTGQLQGQTIASSNHSIRPIRNEIDGEGSMFESVGQTETAARFRQNANFSVVASSAVLMMFSELSDLRTPVNRGARHRQLNFFR